MMKWFMHPLLVLIANATEAELATRGAATEDWSTRRLARFIPGEKPDDAPTLDGNGLVLREAICGALSRNHHL